MKLTAHRMVGWRTSCLRSWVVILGLIAAAAISAQESKPVGGAATSTQPADAVKAPVSPVAAKRVIDPKMPDISGQWRNRKEPNSAGIVILRVEDGTGDFRFENPRGKIIPAAPIKWSSSTQSFEQLMFDSNEKNPAKRTLQLLADGKTLKVTVAFVEALQKELIKNGSITEEEQHELLNQEWVRAELPTEALTPATGRAESEAEDPVDPLKPLRVGLQPATPLAKQMVELFGPRGAKVTEYEAGKLLKIEAPKEVLEDLGKLLELVGQESRKQALPVPDSAAENRSAVALEPATPLTKSLVELFGYRGAKVLEFEAGKRLKVEAPGTVFLELEKMLKLVANETQKQADLKRTLGQAQPAAAVQASSGNAAEFKIPEIVGTWTRAESGTFSKLTIWPVENRESLIFVEGADGNGLMERKQPFFAPFLNFRGFFTFNLLGDRTAKIGLQEGNEWMQLFGWPVEDQRKQLLRSGFAKTERELDQMLSASWTRVAAPAQPKPVPTVTVVKTEFQPALVRDALRAKYREQPYRFFSNDTFQSVIAIAPAEAQDDIEVLIHKLDVKEPEKPNDQATSPKTSSDIPAGMRVASVPVDRSMTKLDLIRPGDHVDVFVTSRRVVKSDGVNRDVFETTMLLEHIEVFAVDGIADPHLLPETEDPKSEDPKPAPTKIGRPNTKNVSLLVTPEQAQQLKQANDVVVGFHLELRGSNDTTSSTKEADSKMPDISGAWLMGKSLGFGDVVILRADGGGGDFAIQSKGVPPKLDNASITRSEVSRVKWAQETRQFEGPIPNDDDGSIRLSKITLQLLAGGKTMRARMSLDEPKTEALAKAEALTKGKMTERELDEYLNQEWTRKPPEIRTVHGGSVSVTETNDGLSFYSKPHGKWTNLTLPRPKDGSSLLNRVLAYTHIVIYQGGNDLYAFIGPTGRLAKLPVPTDFRGSIPAPNVGADFAEVQLGDEVFAISVNTGVWSSPNSAAAGSTEPTNAKTTTAPKMPDISGNWFVYQRGHVVNNTGTVKHPLNHLLGSNDGFFELVIQRSADGTADFVEKAADGAAAIWRIKWSEPTQRFEWKWDGDPTHNYQYTMMVLPDGKTSRVRITQTKKVGSTDSKRSEAEAEYFEEWSREKIHGFGFDSLNGQLDSQEILVKETFDGLAFFSKPLAKWIHLKIPRPEFNLLLSQTIVAQEYAITKTDEALYAFSCRTGRFAKLSIPKELRAPDKNWPIATADSAYVELGNDVYVITAQSGEWSSPNSPAPANNPELRTAPDPVLTRSSPALPDTPAAKQLVEQLAAQESAAAAEAATIRQLQANGQAESNQQPIAEHQRKLKNLLSTAFDLKLQWEELQVQELQSRLSRLERQIGQRKELREKIINRRAGELIEGDALRWDSTRDNAKPQGVTDTKSKDAAQGAQSIEPTVVTTQINFTGPQGMKVSIAGEPLELIAPGRHNFARHTSETQRYDLGFMKVPGAPDRQFAALLDIFPSTPETETFLEHNGVPITLTNEDTRQASTELLIKVIYLHKPRGVTPAIPEVKTMLSTDFNARGDVVAAANEFYGTILAVLRLAENADHLGKLDPKSSNAAITRPRLPSQEVANGGTAERSTSSQPSYQEFAKKLATMNSLVAEAEENLASCQKLFEKGLAGESVVAIDRRKVEEAIRNRKAIQDEYAAILRDLELQIESAQVEVDAAKKEVERVDRSEGAGRRKALEDAEIRLNQLTLVLERLKVRHNLYKKACVDISRPSPPQHNSSDERTFDGMPYSQWLKMLETERKPDKLATAMEACARLAATGDERRIARGLFVAAKLFEATDNAKERELVWNAGVAALNRLPGEAVVAELLAALHDEQFKDAREFPCRFLISVATSPKSSVPDRLKAAFKFHDQELVTTLLKMAQPAEGRNNRLLAGAASVWLISKRKLSDFDGLPPLVIAAIDDVYSGTMELPNRREEPWLSVWSRLVRMELETPGLAILLAKHINNDRTQILGGLSGMGTHAEPAVPLLIENFLVDWKRREKRLRNSGTKDDEFAAVVSLDLRGDVPLSEEERMVQVLNVLGAIGPKAKSAAPLLRQIAVLAPPKRGPPPSLNNRLFDAVKKSLALIGDAPAAEPQEAPILLSEFSRLQGCWNLSALTPNADHKDIQFEFDWQLSIEDKHVRGNFEVVRKVMNQIGAPANVMHYRINDTVTPRQIELIFSKHKLSQLGIYELKDDRLKIELAKPGLPMPKEFSADPNKLPEGHVLLELERDPGSKPEAQALSQPPKVDAPMNAEQAVEQLIAMLQAERQGNRDPAQLIEALQQIRTMDLGEKAPRVASAILAAMEFHIPIIQGPPKSGNAPPVPTSLYAMEALKPLARSAKTPAFVNALRDGHRHSKVVAIGSNRPTPSRSHRQHSRVGAATGHWLDQRRSRCRHLS